MDWTTYFNAAEIGNRIDLNKANERIKRVRRQMLEKTDRDRYQDARLLALEMQNDEMKLILMELLGTLMQREAITEQDTHAIIERVQAVTQHAEPETGEDRLADLQDALGDEAEADPA